MKMTSNIYIDIEELNNVNLRYESQLNNRINMEYIRMEKHITASLSYWINYVWKHNNDAPTKE